MAQRHKIVILGEQSVGKTSMITRWMYDSFDAEYIATIGIDFLSKTVYLEDRVVRLQVWDTAGQERFRALIPSYLRDCHVALVVYDISNRASFQRVPFWVETVRAEARDALVFIVGNKIDRKDRVVSSEEGAALAKTVGRETAFFEVSAKDGLHIKALFRQVASTVSVCPVEPFGASEEIAVLLPAANSTPVTTASTSVCNCSG